jgi:hypothetical protein
MDIWAIRFLDFLNLPLAIFHTIPVSSVTMSQSAHIPDDSGCTDLLSTGLSTNTTMVSSSSGCPELQASTEGEVPVPRMGPSGDSEALEDDGIQSWDCPANDSQPFLSSQEHQMDLPVQTDFHTFPVVPLGQSETQDAPISPSPDRFVTSTEQFPLSEEPEVHLSVADDFSLVPPLSPDDSDAEDAVPSQALRSERPAHYNDYSACRAEVDEVFCRFRDPMPRGEIA